MRLVEKKRRKEISYTDRNHHFWYKKSRRKVCPDCRVCFGRNKICPNCGTELIMISYRAKVPRRNASQGAWKRFWQRHNERCGNNPFWRKHYGN